MLETLVDNARRLIDDARLLHAHGRHRSAASLAILAGEELGKIFIISTSKSSPNSTLNKELNSRRSKQYAFSCLLYYEMFNHMEREALRIYGFDESQESKKKLHTLLLARYGHQQTKNSGGCFSFNPDIFSLFTNSYLKLFGIDDEMGNVTGQIGIGVANTLKKYGFYDDPFINPTGAPPTDNDEGKQARWWIGAVEKVLTGSALAITLLARPPD